MVLDVAVSGVIPLIASEGEVTTRKDAMRGFATPPPLF